MGIAKSLANEDQKRRGRMTSEIASGRRSQPCDSWPPRLTTTESGLLSWVYFALVREAGAAVTSLIAYAVPVVALVLGASLLGEHLTIGALAGLVLIASGTWLTARAQRPRLKQRSIAVRDEHTRARHPRSSG